MAASKKRQLTEYVNEIAVLEKELIFFNQLTGRVFGAEEAGAGTRLCKTGEPYSAGVSKLKSTADDSVYTIKLVSFINARHYVSFGQDKGPVHAHSWQIQIDAKIPSGNPELVAFAKIFEAIRSVLSPYENTVLNLSHPFDKIQPTTENIALYIFNQLEDALSAIGLALGKLTVWETPTKGIEVTSRYAGFDALTAGSEERVEKTAGQYGEVAATSDSGTAVAATGEEKAKGQAGAGTPMEGAVRSYRFCQYAASFVVIVFTAVIAYYSVLIPAGEDRYPWGSDTWGHLFKAEFLYQEILKGNFYPQFTEYWYNGSQPFRYWAPLPYYLLAFLRWLTGDIFVAGSYFIFVCALFGGLSWLFFAGRMGLWPSTMSGAVWTIWQDHVRVAFQEGNLPRVLATALLPVLFFAFLQLLEKRKALSGAAATAVLVHLVVLCHAMISAVYCISLSMFAFFLWVFRGCRFRELLLGTLVLAGGVASASWWLLPGLTGGITEINAEAVKSAALSGVASLSFVPAAVSLDPLYRFTSREVFYWGISILLALLVTLATWRAKPPWAKSLAVCGTILVLITFPSMRLFYVLLPLSHLLWPLRFTSFAALALLASGFTFQLPEGKRVRFLKSYRAAALLSAGLFAVILVDCLFSLRLLVFTTTKSFNLMQSSDFLKGTPGWRVATIDLSRLDSPPSFVYSLVNRREQVFGWAWQGAVTSSNIVLLNTGLEMQYYPFLFRSCLYLGATDMIVLDKMVGKPEDFQEAAERAGYRRQAKFDSISVWHRDDRPYLVEKRNRGIVIGKHAGIIALQFPELEMGSSIYIDDYQLDELQKHNLIILAGAEWRSKAKAEETVTRFAASGGRAFIDLAGMPQNVLARQPEFLGVYGEPVTLKGGLEVSGRGRSFTLQPFSPAIPLWKSYVPLGLDEVELEFIYYGNRAPVYGYKYIGGARVGFLGGGITYHAFLTGDPVASKLVKDIFNLRSEYTPNPVLPLLDYRAGEDGYAMSYYSDHDFEAVVPVAAIDGIRVQIDGEPRPPGKFENLLQLDLPAGGHRIVISIEKTPVYRWGAVLSLTSVFLMVVALLYARKKGDLK